MPRYTLDIDGKHHTVDAAADQPLLYALTNDLHLKGPRFGCGLAQCGTCTVLMNGQPIRSCVTPVSAIGKQAIRTLDGLPRHGQPHPVQAAFIEEQAAQCGYCSDGWVMHTVALLEKNPKPTDEQIHAAFANVQCRCGTHIAIMRAVKTAAAAMSAGSVTHAAASTGSADADLA